MQRTSYTPVPETDPRGEAARAVKKVKKREAQDRFLALIAQGHTVTEALRLVGRSMHAYTLWRKNEPWFRFRVDEIRRREGDADTVTDFMAFRKAYFGYDTFAHHAQIIEAIEQSAPKSVTMILVPPAAGKTTLLETWINYLLGPVDPNLRICMICEKGEEASKRVRRVANRMTDDSQFEPYIAQYGPFKPPDRSTIKPWGAHAISIVRAQNDERDFSMEARGAGGAIYGSRYDWIILDDIQSTKTLNLTEKLLTYIRQSVYTRFPSDPKKGRILVIGTRVGPGDIYERMLEEDMVDTLVLIPALDDEGRSYWPETTLASGEIVGFSEAALATIKRKQGEEIWSRNYMMQPISKRGMTFSDPVITRMLDETRSVRNTNPPGMMTIGTLDPALSGNAAFRIVSYDYDRLYVMCSRSEEGLARFEPMYDIIDELSAIYQPSVWVIEDNALQGGIARSDQVEALTRKHGFRIETHQTGRNKMDQTIGIASMAGAMLGGKISVPHGDEESKDNAALLVKELKRWRSDIPTKLLQQDEVMSLWFAYLHWQRMRSTLASRIDGRIQRQGLPYRPTAYRPLSGVR